MTTDTTYFCPAFMRSDDPDIVAAINARTATKDVPDPDLWREVKASEWYAAKETQDEATR